MGDPFSWDSREAVDEGNTECLNHFLSKWDFKNDVIDE